MRIKPKGRKIYRRKDRIAYHKKIRHDTGSAVMTLVVAAVLGFVGYSAGAPVMNFLQERNFLSPPEQGNTVTAEESADYYPDSTEKTELSESENDENYEEDTPETEPETEEQIGFIQKAPSVQGYQLEQSALMTESALLSALENLPEGISHLLVPLKAEGGEIYYATSVRDAVRSNAVQAVIPLSVIYQNISAKGIEPVAVINTLQDSVFPKTAPEASYLYPETGEFWTDKSSAQEKIWLAPFSTLTQEYLSALCEEIETAGFRTIVCEGLEYPAFPRTELASLAPECGEADRWQYLTELLTAMRASAAESSFFVRLDGSRILSGDTETLQAAESFPADCLLVTVSPENQQEIENLKNISSSVPVIPEWQGEEIPKELKLKTYVLNPEK
ncbi:MAG: hypothetical protein IJ642_02950 [Oscillospiraceae bacterium]|nr:hypothetical protein [Oscillospiraceae bacterium]